MQGLSDMGATWTKDSIKLDITYNNIVQHGHRLPLRWHLTDSP